MQSIVCLGLIRKTDFNAIHLSGSSAVERLIRGIVRIEAAANENIFHFQGYSIVEKQGIVHPWLSSKQLISTQRRINFSRFSAV